ncbi:DUF6314 family protein [Cryptosporangium phraense]|uniref:DUF6314 domain-containing protein n=1 Tax=Cryptosporangium phraense TaxID=2593070 RepID=A0A545AXJ4_9ACTN|nr:DUF6314 family protein [Cryptosporangium phraense]TQS46044.1 hypothetical protein FL583_06030 [Cryptosporangium phraense]
MNPYDLVGEWELARRVVDQATGVHGRVSGDLRVSAETEGLVFAESGVLLWEGHRLPVSRVSRLRSVDGEWWMLFEDGRPFHPWRPGVPVVHPCGADTYDGLVDVDQDGRRMRTLWDVHGPAKSQRLITRFTRRGGFRQIG